MELAGVVGMGMSQEALRPDLLKYVFVKDQEVCDTHFAVLFCSYG